MGEKTAPAGTSTELPLVKALQDVLSRCAADFHSDLRPSPGHVRPRTAKPPKSHSQPEKAYFEQIIENAPEAISIIDQESRFCVSTGSSPACSALPRLRLLENGSTC